EAGDDPAEAVATDSDHADAPVHRRKLVPVHDVDELSSEHQEIVRVAVHRLRALHERTPDPFGLLESEFSLRQLRELHEIVAGESLQADTFRRTMLPLLDPTGQAVSQGRGRPAQTFTRRSELALRADSRRVPEDTRRCPRSTAHRTRTCASTCGCGRRGCSRPAASPLRPAAADTSKSTGSGSRPPRR